ncbi:hypothetical protein [Streptomyces sp. NPDC049585]|uniref:hypothetical protein n=1 Tax=Streptomyces sp. NPDC049585 TaxID=3155154 RepID=UPI003424F6F0
MLEPGEIPQFTGNLAELEKDASGLTKTGGDIRDTGGDIHAKFQGLSAFYHAPEADQLFATTLPVREKAKGFGDKLEKVSSALTEYAAEVRPLAEKLKSLKAEAESFVALVKGDKDWAYDKKKTDHQKRIRSDVDETVAAFYEAERRAANKITSLVGGTQFIADDGSHKSNMYGFKADDLKHAKVPWGEPEDQRHHWYEIGHWVKSFVWDGLIVDGVWGTVKGLGTLVGFDGWDNMKNAWKGLGMLAVGVAVYASPIGRAIPDSMLPKFVQDSKKVAREAGKAMVAWDEWGKNPARAAGAVTFNVLTSITGAGNVAKAGVAGKVVNIAGKAGKIIDPMTYIGKGVGKGLGALNVSVPKVGDLMAGLRNTIGGGKVTPGALPLPHDLAVKVQEATHGAVPATTHAVAVGDAGAAAHAAPGATVPATTHAAPAPTHAAPSTTAPAPVHAAPTVLPDKSVKFPDGTIVHEDGRMVDPVTGPHQNPIPVELSAADRAAHNEIAAATHVAADAEKPVLVHASGGSAEQAAHVGGHGAETSLSSTGRGGEHVSAHAPAGEGAASRTGGHGAGAENAAAHTGGHAAETSLPSGGGHVAGHETGHAGPGGPRPPHTGGGPPHVPSEHGGPNTAAHTPHDTPTPAHGEHGSSEPTPHGHEDAPRHESDGGPPHDGEGHGGEHDAPAPNTHEGDAAHAPESGPTDHAAAPDAPQSQHAPLVRGSELEQRFHDGIRQLPGAKRPKPKVLENILDRLSAHPNGQEIAEVVASGHFAKSENFAQVVSSMGAAREQLMQPAVDQIRFANDLYERGFRDIEFEHKANKADIDVLVRDRTGYAVGYQMKRLNDPLNPIDEVTRDKYLLQLQRADVDHRVLLVDSRGTLADWRSKGYAEILQQVHDGIHPETLKKGEGISFVIRLDDGNLIIPPDGSLYPKGVQ